MTDSRRTFIKQSAVLGGYSLLSSTIARAEWSDDAPVNDILQQTLKGIFKNKKTAESDKIDIQLPKTAVSDAAVPITVTTSLNNVQSIAILIERKPEPLVAKFQLEPELEPFVSTRLKISQSSIVAVIVETNEGFYTAKEKIVVTAGGCED